MTSGTKKSWGKTGSIRAWGNSSAVRIPSNILKQALMYTDTPVTIYSPEPGVIVIKQADATESDRR